MACAALALALLAACAASPPRAPWPASAPETSSVPGRRALPDRLDFPQPTSPRLGRHATPAEIAALDIDVAPDGAGLPPGSGSAAEGASLYATRCAHCHGANGEGTPADPLVGGVGSLASATPVLTVGSFWPYATTLFDYLRRAMPYDSPGSLSNDELYALAAFLLERNGVIAADARLDAASLLAIRMPNREGFESAWPAPGTPANP